MSEPVLRAQLSVVRERLDALVAALDDLHMLSELREDGPRPWPELTDTESRVAELAATGATNRAIAARMYVSPHTVNTHLRHIYDKLGIRSRVALARLVTERGATAG